jgi:hypothetical protein
VARQVNFQSARLQQRHVAAMHSASDIDPESLFSSHSIAQVIDDADEFYSAVSSLSENVGDDVQSVDLDEFFECPSPNEPLVGS